VSFDPPERFNLADYCVDARVREGSGERVAIRTDEATFTYADVQALAHRFGQALRELGVRREERVFLALADGPDFVGALFGVLGIGAVAVMVNPDLEPERLTALFEYCRPGGVVLDPARLGAFDSSLAATAERPPFLVAGSGDAGRHTAFDPGRFDGREETVTTHRDDPAIWLFSGGTTGMPKAVVQSHRSFANTTERYAKSAMGYGPDDITLSVPKLFFGYATGSNLLFPFSVGASAVLFPERPTADVLFEKIHRHRPTILVNVPTMVGQMVGHPEAPQQDLSSLRFATSAGEALPVPLYERWKATFGVELLDGLGTAEMWHIFISNRRDDVRPGTLGKAVAGFDVRVRDAEGVDLPDGEVGHLWVRGGSRAIGYWRDQVKNENAFRGEWFVGGDLVVRDPAGWITYCGRSDDVLKVGGKWLAPQEVESCLMRHSAVAECAVVGVENEEGLVKPYAFVVASGAVAGDLEATLQAHVLASLQPYKHPRRVIVVDALPRTHLGKVDRNRLKKLAAP
jgi:benzoate-CoA ligase family protein